MTIKEIAQITGISAETLRFYEKIGLIPPVPRTKGGIRDYNEYFVQWLAFIQQLKGIGMSLEAIAEYIELAKQGDSTYDERKHLIDEARQSLRIRIKSLRVLAKQADYQLANYDNSLFPETEMLVGQLGA